MTRRENPNFTLEVREWLNSFMTRKRLKRFDRVAARIDDLVKQQGKPDGRSSHDLNQDGLKALTTMPSNGEPTALTYYTLDSDTQAPVVIFLTVNKGVEGNDLNASQRRRAWQLMRTVKGDGDDPSRY